MYNINTGLFRLLLMVLSGVMVLAACSFPGKQDNTASRILIVHSYHAGLDWTSRLHRGVIDTLANKGLHIEVMYMDTKRNTGEEFKKAAGDRVLKKVRDYKPRVVITSDDNAQAYAGRFLVNHDDVSIVFCGVNEVPKTYGYPGDNVTGILERPMIRSSLNLLEKVLHGVGSFTMISDNSPTSKGVVAYTKQLRLNVKIDRFIQTNDFTRWQQQWQAIKSDAIIVFAFHVLRQQGEPVAPADALNWMTGHMHKPVVGFITGDIEAGFLLGHVHSPYEHGELAAKNTLEILEGKKANEIPITTARGGLIVINARTAENMGIDISPIRNIADRIFGLPGEAGNQGNK